MSHCHIYVVGDPACRICRERSDAHDAVLVDLRAERAANGALSVLRAGPGSRTTPDRLTYDPKGAA